MSCAVDEGYSVLDLVNGVVGHFDAMGDLVTELAVAGKGRP